MQNHTRTQTLTPELASNQDCYWIFFILFWFIAFITNLLHIQLQLILPAFIFQFLFCNIHKIRIITIYKWWASRALVDYSSIRHQVKVHADSFIDILSMLYVRACVFVRVCMCVCNNLWPWRCRHLYADTIIPCSDKSNRFIFGILDIVNKWATLQEKRIQQQSTMRATVTATMEHDTSKTVQLTFWHRIKQEWKERD